MGLQVGPFKLIFKNLGTKMATLKHEGAKE